LIRDAGGESVLFPALAIEPLPLESAKALEDLARFSLIIFVSPNAARLAMPYISRRGGVPDQVSVAAVGPGTAAELKKSGVRNIISPREGFDGEALIRELSSRPLEGVRSLVIKGEGGREYLRETLRGRGATVEHVDCYRRVRPEGDMEELLPRWRSDRLNACLATSSSIVENLFEMAGEAGRPWLRNTPFFIPHRRVAATAFSHGVQSIFVTGIGDEALAAGLKTWFARRRTLPASS
jgi:uroporphyrinogen-III synthase